MRRPATEAMLTIAPPPRCFICGITACVPLKGPRRLTAMIRSQSALGIAAIVWRGLGRSEEHTSELQSRGHLVCRLLLEKKKQNKNNNKQLTRILTNHVS